MAEMFNKSLIRNPTRMFGEIRRRAIVHIGAEEAVSMKRDNTYPGQAKPKEGGGFDVVFVLAISIRKLKMEKRKEEKRRL